MQQERVGYGPGEDHFFDLLRPPKQSEHLAILIHGGFWRAGFDLSLMRAAALDLAGRGWLVANLEYRRAGRGGEWPRALEDVRTGITHVVKSLAAGGLPVTAIGHSAGGQLALLAADLVDEVVALAPVTDLVRSDEEDLGESATLEFMRGSASERAEGYRLASPSRQLPIGRSTLLVHGDADERVPVAHTRDFVSAARAAGDAVHYLELPGVTHRPLIDPDRPHWSDVVSSMGTHAQTTIPHSAYASHRSWPLGK